jgi:uracil-DNA glycosylase family 4
MLAQRIATCTRCPLHATRTRVVVYRGAPRPRVLFVGEAPGRDEDLAGVPFVGAAGRRLDRAVAGLGLSELDWGVLNLLKCRPPENRFDPEAAVTCRPHLEDQLALLQPWCLVTLGRHPLAAFDPTAPKITEAAGIVRSWNGHPLFPLLHPAAALHAPRLRERWDSDLRKLGEYLASSAQTL